MNDISKSNFSKENFIRKIKQQPIHNLNEELKGYFIGYAHVWTTADTYERYCIDADLIWDAVYDTELHLSIKL